MLLAVRLFIDFHDAAWTAVGRGPRESHEVTGLRRTRARAEQVPSQDRSYSLSLDAFTAPQLAGLTAVGSGISTSPSWTRTLRLSK